MTNCDMKKKLSLKEVLDYIEELDSEEEDYSNNIQKIFIEPPENEGYFSGEDDAENDIGGAPDDLCPKQLKGGCEIVLKNGRRPSTAEELENRQNEEDVSDILQDVFENSTANISVGLLEPSLNNSKEDVCGAIPKKRKLTKMKSSNEFIWKTNESTDGVIQMFPEPNYEDCRALKPHELFEKFFDDDIFQLIVDQSSKYASFRYQSNPSINIAEIKVFIAILLISGYNYHTSMRNMWSEDDDLRNNLVCNSMRKNRFMEVLKYIHFADNDAPGSSQVPNPDKMWKLRPLTDRLKANMVKNFHPEQHLSYDESMISYFGKHSCKQFIKGKPLRFGYKVWSLCTPSGYLINFEIYQGKSPHSITDIQKKYGKCAEPLIRMIEDFPENIKQLPFSFFFDNLFTNFQLLSYLKSQGYNGTGTMRENRIPNSSPLPRKNELKKEKRGFCVAATEERSGINIVKWVDNSVVSVASTIYGKLPMSNSSRYCREKRMKINIPRPSSITKYNKFMCGVDRMDQNISLYRIAHKGKKWWQSIFTWLIDASVQNAWQLSRRENPNMSNLEFRRQIVIFYCKHFGEKPQRPGPSVNRKRKEPANTVQSTLRYDGCGHYVTAIEKKRRCAWEFCKSVGRTACVKCDVGLCVKCFVSYHTDRTT